MSVEERLREVIQRRMEGADDAGLERVGLVELVRFWRETRRTGKSLDTGIAAVIAGEAKVLEHSRDEFERHLQHVRPDYLAAQDAVLATWEAILGGEVVRDQARLDALSVPPRNGQPLDEAARERWRAPFVDGDELVFFGNQGGDFLEVRVHTREHWVEQERVGEGHREIFLYRGRPLLDGDRPREARVDELGEGEAAAWRKAGLEEHAAEAAFRRAAVELEALGAPSRLVARHHEAAREEMEHARTCFALATLLDGRCTQLPPPLPARARPVGLVEVAAEAMFHGWLGETLAAERVAAEARGAADPRFRAALQEIAREEAGHAALARDVVRWAARSGARRALWSLVGRQPPAGLDARWPILRRNLLRALAV